MSEKWANRIFYYTIYSFLLINEFLVSKRGPRLHFLLILTGINELNDVPVLKYHPSYSTLTGSSQFYFWDNPFLLHDISDTFADAPCDQRIIHGVQMYPADVAHEKVDYLA